MNRLFEKFERLNPEQKEAVLSVVNEGRNTLVIAGPGSGKTRVISVVAGIAYSNEIGVACLSFSNAAADAIRIQINDMLIYEEEALFIGTVHDFCLRHIIYPFAHLIDQDNQDFEIASTLQTAEIESLLKEEGFSSVGRSVTAIRRSVVLNGRMDQDSTELAMLDRYDDLMRQQNLIDFEMIVERAVDYVRRSQLVREYLSFQFGYLLIDEYQDMGGSLHKLVLELLGFTSGAVRFLCVGDPDQLIYGFLGAEENYMFDLKRQGFHLVETKICYRFGRELIRGSLGILDANNLERYRPDDEGKKGSLFFISRKGHIAQATFIVKDLIPRLVEFVGQDKLNRIAILCRFHHDRSIYKTIAERFLDPVSNELGIGVCIERDVLLPNSPFLEWLRCCAGWVSGQDDPNVLNQLPDLFRYYLHMLSDAGTEVSTASEFALELQFQKVLLQNAVSNKTVSQWVSQFLTDLEIRELLSKAGNKSGSLKEIALLFTDRHSERKMKDLVLKSNANAVVLTTMHASKGREFDYVILPTIEAGVIPDQRDRTNMSAVQRLFYVACTRARSAVYIISSQTNRYLPELVTNIPELRFEQDL